MRGTIRLAESVVGKERAKEILAGGLVEVGAFTFEEKGETTIARYPVPARAAPDGTYQAEFKEFLADTINLVVPLSLRMFFSREGIFGRWAQLQ